MYPLYPGGPAQKGGVPRGGAAHGLTKIGEIKHPPLEGGK